MTTNGVGPIRHVEKLSKGQIMYYFIAHAEIKKQLCDILRTVDPG